MFVALDRGTATVHEADDCTSLHLALHGYDLAGARAALSAAGLGDLIDRDTAFLDLDSLLARAEPAASVPDWQDRWQAMIGYAARKGWLSADHAKVQVHCTWAS